MKVIESMYDTTTLGYLIRVWRNEEKVRDEYNNSDITTALRELMVDPVTFAPPPKKDVIDAILTCDRINAIEIKDQFYKDNVKQGVVYYPEWP